MNGFIKLKLSRRGDAPVRVNIDAIAAYHKSMSVDRTTVYTIGSEPFEVAETAEEIDALIAAEHSVVDVSVGDHFTITEEQKKALLHSMIEDLRESGVELHDGACMCCNVSMQVPHDAWICPACGMAGCGGDNWRNACRITGYVSKS